MTKLDLKQIIRREREERRIRNRGLKKRNLKPRNRGVRTLAKALGVSYQLLYQLKAAGKLPEFSLEGYRKMVALRKEERDRASEMEAQQLAEAEKRMSQLAAVVLPQGEEEKRERLAEAESPGLLEQVQAGCMCNEPVLLVSNAKYYCGRCEKPLVAANQYCCDLNRPVYQIERKKLKLVCLVCGKKHRLSESARMHMIRAARLPLEGV